MTNTLGDVVKEVIEVIETSVFQHASGESYVLIEEKAAKRLTSKLKAVYLAESKQEPADGLSRLKNIMYDAIPLIFDLQERVSVLETQLRQLDEGIFIATKGKEL